MKNRDEFSRCTKRPSAAQLSAAVKLAKGNQAEGRLAICQALSWVAFACPAAADAVYDALADSWLDGSVGKAIPQNLPEAPLPPCFWKAFWSVIDASKSGYDATSITEAVAALGGAVDETFGPIAEHHAVAHPGADNAHKKAIPGLTDIEALSRCEPESLGRTLYELLTVNGYDAEVLDRNAILLNELPPALCYLNTRILQMHDVWHLVAGYQTTGTQEVSISAFQLAQFGHNYSGMFLAVAATIGHMQNPRGFAVLMQIILEGWRHGRTSPSLMAIEWEQEWDTPIDDLRRKYGIQPLQSIFPAELVETLNDGNVWSKLKLGWRLLRFNRSLQQVA